MKAQDVKIFMRQAEVTLEEKGLWCLLNTWADADGTGSFPSQKLLAAQTGRKIGWIKKHIAILRKKGHLIITKEKRKGAQHFHNVYTLKPRGYRSTGVHPYGSTAVTTTKSLYQNSDSLAVESEAILRVVPKDNPREDSASYG